MKKILRGLIIIFCLGFIFSFCLWIKHYQETLTVVLGSLDPMDVIVHGYNQNTLQKAQTFLLKQGYGVGVQRFIQDQILFNPFTITMLLCFIGTITAFLIGYVYNHISQKRKENAICLALENEQNIAGNTILEKVDDMRKKYQTKIRMIALDQDSQNQELENIAHQMKSTLSTILLNVDQISNSENESEIQTIIKQVDRSNKMLNRFLQGHEVRSNLSNYQYEVKNLADSVQSSIQRVSLPLETKQLKIQSNLVDCVMAFDPFWIEESIETILFNAIDFAYKNTLIQIEMIKDKNHIQIVVINEGDEPNDIHSIFMRYGSSRTQNEHFGIGLHMVRTVCRNHLGDISAFYVSNRMKFVLTLPLNRLESIQYQKDFNA